MIRFDHVTKAFDGRTVLDDVSVTVPDGGTLVITGPNGSGKSTLLKLALGLLTPDSGFVAGGAVGQQRGRPRSGGGPSPHTAALAAQTNASGGRAPRKTAAVFQEDRLCEQLGAVGNVRLVLDRPVSNDEIVSELGAAGLSGEALNSPVRRLSGGERRRVCLVRAMMARADLVCLDEPFTGVDATLDQAMAYVHDRLVGRDALLVTHSPAEVAAFAGQLLDLTR